MNLLPVFIRRAKRHYQFKSLYRFFEGREFGEVLEIGAGKRFTWEKRINCRNFIKTDLQPALGFEVANVTKLPYKSGRFGLVLCISVLEHLNDVNELQKAIGELKRVTAPGGLLVVAIPFLYPFHRAPVDSFRLTLSGLKRCFAWPVLFDLKTLNWLPGFYSSSVAVFQNDMVNTTITGRTFSGMSYFGLIHSRRANRLLKEAKNKCLEK